MKDNLKELISRYGLDNFAEAIISSAEPAIQMIKQPLNESSVGKSRMGGLPDVAPDFAWPIHEGRSLGFLTQINASELKNSDMGHVLPDSGMLYFFYDMVDQPWGFDPKNKGGAKVIYSQASSLTTASAPDDLDANSILPSIPIGFVPFLSLPGMWSERGSALKLDHEQQDSYSEIYNLVHYGESGNRPAHQLLGHPDNIQSDMELECQLVTNGIYCGNSDGYKDPRRKTLEPGAAEWRLLMQFDSDDDLNLMWGDTGILYFWIKKGDLNQRLFSNTWTILQCH